MGENRTEACCDLVFPVGDLAVLIDFEAHLFKERAVVGYSVFPERQPGHVIRVKLKGHECEASTRTENPGDLDQRRCLVGDVLEGINAHHRIG